MKNTLGARLLSLLLAAVMVLGLVPVLSIPKVEAASYIDIRNAVQGLGYPVATRVTSLPQDMSGLWIIANYHQRVDDTSNRKYILDPDNTNSWGPPDFANNHSGHESYPVHKLSNNANKLDIPHSKYYIRITGSPSSMQLRDYRGLYWDHIYGNAGTWGNFQLSTWSKVYYKAEAVGDTYRVRRIEAEDIVVYMNGYTYRVALTGKLALDTHPQYQLEFYKVSEEVLGLRDVLQEALKYVVDNSNGRFDPAVYQAYLEFLHSAAVTYNQKFREAAYNAVDSAALNQLKTDIWDQMAKMKLYDYSQEFIDIPIEVLDFRGDGFLFEAAGTFDAPYNLSKNSDGVGTGSFPGTVVYNDSVADTHNFQVTGLVESQLVDGKVVYTRETVDYIASHLQNRTEIKEVSDYMNGAFINLLKSGKLRAGNYDDTLTRCEHQKAGGELSFYSIETYHDLAYYLLSHMWAKTDENLGQDTNIKGQTENITYNTVVPELTKLRLFKSGDRYVYDNGLVSCYKHGYIFNDSTGRPVTYPAFRPIDGLGFEHPDRYGIYTEGRRTDYDSANYSFTIHAYGGFVYTEDANLYFSFSGDDDVYFFVNGKLVCDLGGIHGAVGSTVYINNIATSLGLEEGQVCRFDMFHAERHTTGINFNLSTNMKLMDEELLTEKTQYDPETGQPLMSGTAVNTGTQIAYAYSLRNIRSGLVGNIKFSDPHLGVEIDPFGSGLVLNNETGVEDLEVIYTTYDPRTEAFAENVMELEDLAAAMNFIWNGNDSMGDPTAIEQGVYVYRPQSEEDLLTLLGFGMPPYCKLTIRGFRYTVETKGVYDSPLNTQCTPIRYEPNLDGGYSLTNLEPAAGVADCSITAMSLEGITIQKPYSVVMDYGKPVEMNPNATNTFITLSSGMHMEYVGSTLRGEHGLVRANQPINLTFTAAGQKAESDYGYFEMMDGDTLRYTPKGFIETVDPFYAVYKITIDGQADFKAFLMTAVEFLPAHMVYYEAESFTDEISITKKTTAAGTTSIQTEWGTENYEKEGNAGSVLQDHTLSGQELLIPDYSTNRDVIFFGFDNTANDRTRYTLPQYGNVGNYDDPANQNKLWYAYQERSAKVKKYEIKNGAMVITALPEAGAAANATENDKFPDLYLDTIYGGNLVGNSFGGWANCPLNYNPKNAEVIQFRFKLENFRIGTNYVGTEIFPYMRVEAVRSATSGVNFAGNSTGFIYLHTDMLNSGEYITVTAPIYSAFRDGGNIKRLRFYWGGLESISASRLGELTIDYLYIGPYGSAPTEVGYGFDSSYIWNSKLSDGSSLYVEGNGVRTQANPDPDKYTELKFDFTGTGFDLITRTGAQQGTLRVEIYEDEARTQLKKSMTVNNKGTLELYQIPTVSVEDLPHGKYYVTVMVNAAVNSQYEILKRGDQLYLDAIRIYDPIDVSKGAASTDPDAMSAFTAYCADSEVYADIQEVREILLSAKQFNALQSATTGAVYVDSVGNTASISTYEKEGPKNEVYLSSGQKIAFRLDIKSKEIPDRLDIGCKTISGTDVYLKVAQAKADSTELKDKFVTYERRFRSATAMYYPIHIWKQGFTTDTSGSYIYIIVENTGTNVLSVTDIKVAYDHTPSALATAEASAASVSEPGAKRNGISVELPLDSFVEFTVDGEIQNVIDAWVDFSEKGIHDHIPGYWISDGEVEKQFCERCGVLLDSRPAPVREDPVFSGASVSLQSDLAIHFKVKETYFTEGGYTDPYVVFQDNGTETVIRDYVLLDGKYSFVYRNIAPHRMGDTITATLYATYNGETYAFDSRDYSVAEYCYNMLGKTAEVDSYATLRTLLVDILHYGAETQKYMSYRLDSLCNSRLSEEELACGSELTRELVSHRDPYYEVIDNPTVQWKGAGLNLRESVAVRFRFIAEDYEGLVVKVTMVGKTYTYKEEDFEYKADGTYVHFRNINAAQMSEPILVAVYRDGVQVSNTISYSIESYACSKESDTNIPHLADLVKRMMCYGDSCKAYVGD